MKIMEKMQFKAESARLLDLMINSIYTHKEIFLREIISNASDAMDKLAYTALTDDKVGLNRDDFAITITRDEENRILTVSDNGIGMSRADMEENLGTIAKSGSLAFKKAMEKTEDIDIIGQFGVGFYSAFMVAESVTVISRKYGEEKAWKWTSDGADGYTIEEAHRPCPGTDVIMTIKADTEEEKYGEIPNIAYDNAYLEINTDENGKYIAVGGTLDYDIAFVKKYHFTPECRLYSNANKLRINVKLENMKGAPTEYMYLCHINFRPFDGARLVYNVPRDREHVKVHKIVPDTLPLETQKKLSSYMDKLEENPAIMDKVGNPEEIYLPEICFALKYKPDENNRGYTMQVIDGEGACYVNHPVDTLPVGVRWISRTPDEDSMGMILPATSEHLGYYDSKARGFVKELGAYESLEFYMEVGFIDDAEAKKVEEKVNALIK